MKKQIERKIKDLEDKILEDEKEWDRLDSTGQTTQQQQLTKDMVEANKEIKDLKELLKTLDNL